MGSAVPNTRANTLNAASLLIIAEFTHRDIVSARIAARLFVAPSGLCALPGATARAAAAVAFTKRRSPFRLIVTDTHQAEGVRC
jgi:hypothetical protein